MEERLLVAEKILIEKVRNSPFKNFVVILENKDEVGKFYHAIRGIDLL